MEETIARVTNPGMVGIAGPRVENTATPPAKKMELEPKRERKPKLTADKLNQFIGDYSKMQQSNRLNITFQASIERVKPGNWDPAYLDLWWNNEDVLFHTLQWGLLEELYG